MSEAWRYDFTVALTDSEAKYLVRLHLPQSPKLWSWRHNMAGAQLGMLAGMVTLLSKVTSVYGACLVAIIGYFSFFSSYFYLIHAFGADGPRKIQARVLRAKESFTLMIELGGVTAVWPHHRHTMAWKYFDRAEESAGLLLFWAKEHTAVWPLPVRLCVSPNGAAEILRNASAAIVGSQEQPD